MDQDLQHRHILGIPIISLGPKGQLRLGIWPSYSTGTSWEIPVMFLGQIGQIGPRIWQYLAHGYWEFPYVLTTSKANRVTWTWDVNTAQGHVGNSSWKTGTVQCPGILASLGTATVVPNCPSVLWCPKNPGICDGNPGQPWPSTFLLYNCRRSRGWMWGNLWRLDGQDTKVHTYASSVYRVSVFWYDVSFPVYANLFIIHKSIFHMLQLQSREIQILASTACSSRYTVIIVNPVESTKRKERKIIIS